MGFDKLVLEFMKKQWAKNNQGNFEKELGGGSHGGKKVLLIIYSK